MNVFSHLWGYLEMKESHYSIHVYMVKSNRPIDLNFVQTYPVLLVLGPTNSSRASGYMWIGSKSPNVIKLCQHLGLVFEMVELLLLQVLGHGIEGLLKDV